MDEMDIAHNRDTSLRYRVKYTSRVQISAQDRGELVTRTPNERRTAPQALALPTSVTASITE